MTIDSDFIINLFKQPDILIQCDEWTQSNVVVVLRQQKVLARYAYFCGINNVMSALHEKTQRHLKNALKVAHKQKEQVLYEAKELSCLLKPDSDFVVFLKGAAYSLSETKVGFGRIYSDIDVLVNKPQLNACEQTLAVHGWLGQEINDYDDKYYRKWAHEIPPLAHSQRGTVIDIHHNIIPIISNDAPTVEALAKHVITTSEGIQILDLPAQFVHSAVHLFRNEDYSSGFRDLLDLYLMLVDQDDKFVRSIVDTSKELGFLYEVGLAFDCVNKLVDEIIDYKLVETCLIRSKLRIAFDRYLFKDVLLPQHSLIIGMNKPFKHFFAIVRGHFIKMPFHFLMYHLFVKSGRGIVQYLFGKHVFTAKDEHIDIQTK